MMMKEATTEQERLILVVINVLALVPDCVSLSLLLHQAMMQDAHTEPASHMFPSLVLPCLFCS